MSELKGLDKRMRRTAEAFVHALESAGLRVTITSVVRSQVKQRRLYEEYIAAKAAGRPHLPALPPGHSLHEHGLAFDMVVSPAGYLPACGALWKQLGGQWGGDSQIGYDPVHFQAKQFLHT